MNKTKVLFFILIVIIITLFSILYYDLNEKYTKLKLHYEYAMKMSKICLEDSEYCDEIKKSISEFKNKKKLI